MQVLASDSSSHEAGRTPLCFPGGPEGHGEQNRRNSMWELLVLQSLPLYRPVHRPVPLGEANATTDTLAVKKAQLQIQRLHFLCFPSHTKHVPVPHRDILIHVYTCTCMCLQSYGGEFFPLSTKFLYLQVFLGPSVLQLLPKGHTFRFHFTKISIFPEGSKKLFQLETTSSGCCQADVI